MFAYRLVPVLATLMLASPRVIASPLDTETHIGVVSTEGLDLTSASGRAALDSRLRREVNALCGAPEGHESLLAAVNAVRQCRASALHDVQGQVAAVERAATEARATMPARVSSIR